MKPFLAIFLLLFLRACPDAAQPKPITKTLSVYIVAHQDDWQLFMGVNAFNDIEATISDSTRKVVFIYVTAGDAGLHYSDYSRSRERGAAESIHFVYDSKSQKNPPRKKTESAVISYGKDPDLHVRSIPVYRYRQTASYYLRIPEERDKTGQTPLQNLRNGKISSLSTIRNNPEPFGTTYANTQDIAETIRAIILAETTDSTTVKILNAPDTNETENPNDHPDHYQTGTLAQLAVIGLGFTQNLFEEYITDHKPENLSADDIVKETSVFVAYCIVKLHSGCGSDWGNPQAMKRNYFRTVDGNK
jgi:hypothetical protein